MKHVLLPCALLLSSIPAPAADATKSEYCSRLAAVAPRDANAFVELAEWCKSTGLEAEAEVAYREALAIDEDCEKARTALGYRRYGTGWRRPGQQPEAMSRPLRKPAAAASVGRESTAAAPAPASRVPAQPAPEATAAPALEPAAIAAPSPTPEATHGSPTPEPAAEKKPQPETGSAEPAATSRPVAGALDKKREWAKAAAARLSATFSTVEDADFLIHSTLPASSREVKLLHGHLKSLKKIIGGVIGAGAGTKMWPDKFQAVLLKSEPEYERFAEFVDEMRSAKNPDGAYEQGGHTVLWIPDSGALARILALSALETLNGSNRWVPPWMQNGVSEFVHSQSPLGLKESYYEKTMIFAADVVKGEGDALKIYNVIESRETARKDQERAEALALSFVDFLLRQNRKGFQDVVKAIKSDKAPEPPAQKGADIAAFHLGFISFQEETLRKSFSGAALNVLGDKWKAYVLAQGETLKAREEEKTPKTNPKAKAKGGKGKPKEKDKDRSKEGEKGR
jgi:hypothetical protein